MATLSLEITEEILSLLPIKSIARFRCVSTSWNSRLFNSTVFSKLRFKNAPHHPQMDAKKLLISTCNSLKSLDYESCFGNEDGLIDLDFSLKKPDKPVIIWGSCKGLVCVSIENYKDIYIWNPSTGIYRKLPNPGRFDDYSFHSYGFGFDPASNDFKAVIISTYWVPRGRHSTVTTNSEVKVFSLTANSWKLLPNILINSSFNDPNGSFLNGAIHWKPSNLQAEAVVAFDVASENFFEIPMPDWMIRRSALFQRLGVLLGSLCLTHFAPPSFHIRELWVMKEYGNRESWTKMVERCNYNYSVLPLCDAEKGCIILLDGGSLIKHDLEENSLESFKICRDRLESLDCVVVPYAEKPTSPCDWNG